MQCTTELKTIEDGYNAFLNNVNKVKNKAVFRTRAFYTDMQQLYDTTLKTYEERWRILGLYTIEDVGYITEILFGSLCEKFCTDTVGYGRVTTETLIIMYDILQFYIHAQEQQEKSIVDNIENKILQDNKYRGVTKEDVENLKAIIVFKEFCNLFELKDIDGENEIEQMLHKLCISEGIDSTIIKKTDATNYIPITQKIKPDWKFQKAYICNKYPLLHDIRFSRYIIDKTKDCYVYTPFNDRAEYIIKLCVKKLKLQNDKAETLAKELFYIGLSKKILGKYSAAVLSGAPQKYDGCMQRLINNMYKQNKDFFDIFYRNKVIKHTIARIGAFTTNLLRVPNISIYNINTEFVVFGVTKGTDITTIFDKNYLCDIQKISSEFSTEEFYNILF